MLAEESLVLYLKGVMTGGLQPCTYFTSQNRLFLCLGWMQVPAVLAGYLDPDQGV